MFVLESLFKEKVDAYSLFTNDFMTKGTLDRVGMFKTKLLMIIFVCKITWKRPFCPSGTI